MHLRHLNSQYSRRLQTAKRPEYRRELYELYLWEKNNITDGDRTWIIYPYSIYLVNSLLVTLKIKHVSNFKMLAISSSLYVKYILKYLILLYGVFSFGSLACTVTIIF